MDEYKKSLRVEHVAGDITYNQHQHEHHYPAPPPAPHKPARPGLWGWVGGLAAAMAIGGTMVTTHLNAKVYYCASHNSVKYHTDATCSALKQCGTTVKSMPLSQARSKMDLCKVCH